MGGYGGRSDLVVQPAIVLGEKGGVMEHDGECAN